MRRFVQIYNNKAWWIFEAEEKPEFAPDIVLMDITGRDDIQEGWDYNEETGEFSKSMPIIVPPIELQPTLEEMQTQALLNTEYLVIMSELNTL